MINHTNEQAPEVKASTNSAGDVQEAFDDFMGGFEAFRETNDDRLNQID